MSTLIESYQRMLEHGDPRVKDWPLMSSPIPTHAIVILYCFFVTRWGPAIMANRPAYDLRYVIMAYNAALVYLSWYTFWNVGWNGWFTYYNWSCQPVDTSDRPEAMGMARLTWLFFVSKLIELLDTVFFVVRKKNRQITPLHIIHHTGMPLCMWWATKFVPGGHGSIVGLVNSLVHVIMYSYYFLAAFGARIEPYLWWKRYITQLQLLQFGYLFCHSTLVLLNESCQYPRAFTWLIELPSVMFIFLFGQFYINTYRRSERAKLKADTDLTDRMLLAKRSNTKGA